jgi:hypothetical protein
LVFFSQLVDLRSDNFWVCANDFLYIEGSFDLLLCRLSEAVGCLLDLFGRLIQLCSEFCFNPEGIELGDSFDYPRDLRAQQPQRHEGPVANSGVGRRMGWADPSFTLC